MYTSEYILGENCQPDDYYCYQLKGVVVHAGTAEGGHYYSFIRENFGEKGGEWY
jgi:ubiquitin C-terminal hydrolase